MAITISFSTFFNGLGNAGAQDESFFQRLTKNEFGAKIREQRGLCGLCSDLGSVGGLVTDVDAIRRRVRGLIHPKCKRLLALVCENPIRLQKAIDYLERHGSTLFQNPLWKRRLQVIEFTRPTMEAFDVRKTGIFGDAHEPRSVTEELEIIFLDPGHAWSSGPHLAMRRSTWNEVNIQGG